MKKVTCVGDSNQPQGANAVKNTEYTGCVYERYATDKLK